MSETSLFYRLKNESRSPVASIGILMLLGSMILNSLLRNTYVPHRQALPNGQKPSFAGA